MKRVVIIGAVIGFAVSIFWGIVGFLLFTAPQSPMVDLFWKAVHITCPPWMIPESSSVLGNAFVTPFLNAALYAGIALTVYALLKPFRSGRTPAG